MSIQPEERVAENADEATPPTGSFAVAAVVAGVAAYLTYGLLTMDVPDTADFPGPRFFPTVIAVLAYLLAVALLIQGLRQRTQTHPTEPQGQTSPVGTDWVSVAGIVATLLVFTALLRPLGWILAGTLLFYGVAAFLGSRRRLFDLGLALGVSSIVQLIFSAGLGLNLPAGVLGVF